MKRVLYLICAACVALSTTAQKKDTQIQLKLDDVKAQLVEFDTETKLDSLDQEKLPRLVSGGVFGGGNLSNFIITRNHKPMSSYMRIGAEVGGFLDFSLSKHFAIQPHVIFTAQQNYFAATDTTNRLWSFGMEIPVYFLGRFGNLDKGYIQFGGGIFTHFTFASNTGKYKSVDDLGTPVETTETTESSSKAPSVPVTSYDYSRLYSLHNNHFGVCALVGYECPFGMVINLTYKVSLSDIAGFYSEMKGQEIANALIYPQSISLCIGYRWK